MPARKAGTGLADSRNWTVNFFVILFFEASRSSAALTGIKQQL
jgi:hypothetical protein